MGPRSRFLDVERIHRRVPGCPLLVATPGASDGSDGSGGTDEAACALCPHNLLAPGVAQIGCEVRTPADVVAAARHGLAVRDASLAGALASLLATGHRSTGTADDEATRRLLAVAESWYVTLGEDGPTDQAEREVARLIARFARASLVQGEPVEILG